MTSYINSIMDLLPGETPKAKFDYLDALIKRENKIPEMKRDFQCKIQMKDHLWDTFNDVELKKLDEFEEKLNAELLAWFRDYLKYDSTVIIL